MAGMTLIHVGNLDGQVKTGDVSRTQFQLALSLKMCNALQRNQGVWWVRGGYGQVGPGK